MWKTQLIIAGFFDRIVTSMITDTTSRVALRSTMVFAASILLFFGVYASVSAAAVTVNCSGTSGSPTTVTEVDLASDDVTFSDAGGDGYCELDESISAASVDIEAGVVLTHVAEDTDGVTITTTGNFTLTGDINVDEKGCPLNEGPSSANACSDGGSSLGGEGTSTSCGYGGGAGHARAGGDGNAPGSNPGGGSYGDAYAPVLFGSGGGDFNGSSATTYGNGGSGGGFVTLTIGGDMSLAGTISSDGGAGTTQSAGGSGGSIYIRVAGALTGSGTVQTDGGAGAGFSGGGTGGRIAVYSVSGDTSTLRSNASSALGAKGGSGDSVDGSVGSILFVTDPSGDSEPSSGLATSETDDDTWYPETFTFQDEGDGSDDATIDMNVATLTVFGTGTSEVDSDVTTLNVEVDTLAVSGNGAITCLDTSTAAWNWTSIDSFSWADHDLTCMEVDWGTEVDLTFSGSAVISANKTEDIDAMTINSNSTPNVALTLSDSASWVGNVLAENLTTLTIGASASINADEKGCEYRKGPTSANVCETGGSSLGGEGSITTSGGQGPGAGHGGVGGDVTATNGNGGGTYGTNTNPIYLGSGGGEYTTASGGSPYGRGGTGGGRILIETSGNASIDGTLSVDAGAGTFLSGGGSGGSIKITVGGSVSGSGTLTAVGGNGAGNGGSGGGGRIAVIYVQGDSSTLETNDSAAAGTESGSGDTGGAGTLYYEDQAPTFASAQYQDSNSDGQVDRIVIDFSEDVSLGGTVDATTRFTLTSPTGASGFGGSLSGNASVSSGDIIVTITSADADETGASGTVQIAYDDNSDDATNKIVDSGGSILETFSAQTASDAADPFLVSSSPANGDSNISSSADIVLTFSESMDTGSIAYTCCGAGDDPGRSGVWSSSDTVYTISPSSSWTAGDDVTINITAAPDTSSNTFAGSGPSAADPFTFTIANVGDTPTNIGGVVTTATLTAPNGGQSFEGGDTTTITWSAGANKLDSISLWYTMDQGRTFTLIAEEEENDGAYIWTVPNITSSTVKVKVGAMNASGGELVSDLSNSYFSIVETDNADIPQVSTDDEETDERVDEDPDEVVTTMTDRNGKDIDLVEGYLFRGDTLSDVYLVKNGMRYVFPSADVFLSYYEDFDDVYFMQDDQLRKLDLGGRVTMAPGEMIKIQSDNRVFQVQSDGTISHIPDEATAIALYGDTWNQQITDISVIFWGDYPQGDALASL